MYHKSGAQAYNQINQQSHMVDADPHKLIQMLMQGALDKINMAKGHMLNNNIEPKGVQISIAISIIDGLQASLDLEKGGEIAKNLNQLYSYMMEQLVLANLNNEVKVLEEVYQLMVTIKEGWDGISESAQSKKNASDK